MNSETPKPGRTVLRSWWLLPTLAYLGSRILYLIYLSSTVHLQTVNSAHEAGVGGAKVNLWTALSNWDSTSYYYIASHGYPEGLPRGTDGAVTLNNWAFYPLWPYLLRGVHHLLPLSYPLLGTLLSTAFGLAGLLLIYRWVLRRSNGWLAACLVVWLCFFPPSAVMLTGYAEALTILLLGLLIWALERRWWIPAAVLIFAVCLTRPIGLAFVLPLAVAAVWSWHRGDRRAFWSYGSLSLFAAVAFMFWPAAVGRYSGEANGYWLTQQAWRGPGTRPILPYLFSGNWDNPWLYLLYGGLLALMAATLLLGRADQKWPAALRLWAASYWLYIYCTIQAGFYFNGRVMDPQGPLVPHPSVWRYLMLGLVPLLPYHLAAKPTSSRLHRALVLGAVVVAGALAGFFYCSHFLLDRSDIGLYWP